MEQEIKNFLKAWAIVIPSVCYTYFISSKLPKGILRFFSLLPIFSLFTLLPLSLSRPLLIIILGWFITWLANFKLLLYSFDLGPLSTQKTLIGFILFAVLPIVIKDTKCPKFEGCHRVKVQALLNFGSKSLLGALLLLVYQQIPKCVVLTCLVYLFIDLAFGVCALLVKGTLGGDVDLEPPSDEPYMSTSLQDLWGRRWNRMTSHALRHTIYEPTRSLVGKFVGGRRWAPNIGKMTTFMVSGLMHELIYYYATRVKPTWEVTWFFALHGGCVVLENEMKRGLGHRLRLHSVVAGPMTIGFLIVTSKWLLFPQMLRNYVDVKVIEDVMDIGKFMMKIVK